MLQIIQADTVNDDWISWTYLESFATEKRLRLPELKQINFKNKAVNSGNKRIESTEKMLVEHYLISACMTPTSADNETVKKALRKNYDSIDQLI